MCNVVLGYNSCTVDGGRWYTKQSGGALGIHVYVVLGYNSCTVDGGTQNDLGAGALGNSCVMLCWATIHARWTVVHKTIWGGTRGSCVFCIGLQFMHGGRWRH